MPLRRLEPEVDAELARALVVGGGDLTRVRNRLVEVVAGDVEACLLHRREDLAAQPALQRARLLPRLRHALAGHEAHAAAPSSCVRRSWMCAPGSTAPDRAAARSNAPGAIPGSTPRRADSSST